MFTSCRIEAKQKRLENVVGVKNRGIYRSQRLSLRERRVDKEDSKINVRKEPLIHYNAGQKRACLLTLFGQASGWFRLFVAVNGRVD